MAHVVRIFGSPDRWIAQCDAGWVDEKGNVVNYRVLPDSAKQEFVGTEGDKKIELLGGFGGRFAPAKVASVKEHLLPAPNAAEKPKS